MKQLNICKNEVKNYNNYTVHHDKKASCPNFVHAEQVCQHLTVWSYENFAYICDFVFRDTFQSLDFRLLFYNLQTTMSQEFPNKNI